MNGISNKDAELLGFKNGTHPRDLILEAVPVIPPCARPFTVRDGQIKEDHLTTVYDEIVRDNYKYSVVKIYKPDSIWPLPLPTAST